MESLPELTFDQLRVELRVEYIWDCTEGLEVDSTLMLESELDTHTKMGSTK